MLKTLGAWCGTNWDVSSLLSSSPIVDSTAAELRLDSNPGWLPVLLRGVSSAAWRGVLGGGRVRGHSGFSSQVLSSFTTDAAGLGLGFHTGPVGPMSAGVTGG